MSEQSTPPKLPLRSALPIGDSRQMHPSSSRFHPWVQRIFFAFALCALFIGIPWLIVNELARRDWAAAKRDLIADGESLDFEKLLSPPVAEEENFCATATLMGVSAEYKDPVFGRQGLENRVRIEKTFSPAGWYNGGVPSGIRTGQRFDFTAQALRMQVVHSGNKAEMLQAEAEVRKAFGPAEALIADWAERVDKPRAQWVPALASRIRHPLGETELPEGEMGRYLPKGLLVRTMMAAHDGDAQEAFLTTHLVLRFAEAEKDSPFLGSFLDALNYLSSASSAVWEMADAQVGSPDEWRILETELSRWELRPLALRSARGTMAWGVEYALSEREVSVRIAPPFARRIPEPVLSKILPRAIFLNNASSLGRLTLEHTLRPLRILPWEQVWRHAVSLQAVLDDAREHPHRDLSMVAAVYCIPYPPGLIGRVIYAQAIVNQAIIACALERHRLERGSYPESLEDLSLADGKPLPLDPFTQKPLHYRRSEHGRYILWSISLNGADHHGLRAPPRYDPLRSSPYTEKDDGDWVWAFPEDGEATGPAK